MVAVPVAGVTGADVEMAAGEALAASVVAMVADPIVADPGDVVPEVDRDLGGRETETAAASSRG